MYESPELLLYVLEEEDIVRTSPVSSENPWGDDNADLNGWNLF